MFQDHQNKRFNLKELNKKKIPVQREAIVARKV